VGVVVQVVTDPFFVDQRYFPTLYCLGDGRIRHYHTIGEADGEGGAVTEATVDADLAAVELNDAFANRQAQAGAVFGGGGAGAGAVKALEQFVDFLGCNALAVVGDR